MSVRATIVLALQKRLSNSRNARARTRVIPPRPAAPIFRAIPDERRPQAAAAPIETGGYALSVDDVVTTPVALSILGLEKHGERAQALQAVLQRLRGVVRAYVSPFTELAYVDYAAAQVTENQLVEAVVDAGYRVDEQARRFAWRRT